MLIKRINVEQLGNHCYEEIRRVINNDIKNLTPLTFEHAMKQVAPCGFRVVQWAENDDLEPGEFMVAIVRFESLNDWIFFKMRAEI